MHTFEEVAIKVESIKSLHLLVEHRFYKILGSMRNYLIHSIERINLKSKIISFYVLHNHVVVPFNY